jgi:hypothetical protein
MRAVGDSRASTYPNNRKSDCLKAVETAKYRCSDSLGLRHSLSQVSKRRGGSLNREITIMMNRRFVLGTGAVWIAGQALTGPSMIFCQSPVPPGPEGQGGWTAEDWFDAVMKDHSSSGSAVDEVEGALYLSRFVEPMYFITRRIKWKPNAGQSEFSSVTVPSGFVTDLASIPSLFWSFLRPDGEYAYAAIIHDYLYWVQDGSRSAADKILKMAMEDFGVSPQTIYEIYGAVRADGGRSWDDNAKLRKAGEKRVLKRFPTDPRTRWADWKSKPEVFGDL